MDQETIFQNISRLLADEKQYEAIEMMKEAFENKSLSVNYQGGENQMTLTF